MSRVHTGAKAPVTGAKAPITGAKAPITLRVLRLAHGAELPLPAYHSEGAAGLDLIAAVPEGSPLVLAPGARALVPTGLTMAIPAGFEGQVRPRSGLALRYGVTVLNSPGTIDSDYRGEVKVLVINHGEEPFEIERGGRIAQLVLRAVERAAPMEVAVLEDSERGACGFGSTGTNTVGAC